MKRPVIRIDENLCTGCGLCLPNCPEGALALVDGKVRLVSEVACDGLGACLGHCPEGAISVEEREAAPYDERTVLGSIVQQGPAAVAMHLEHLRAHGQWADLEIAEALLEEAETLDGSGQASAAAVAPPQAPASAPRAPAAAVAASLGAHFANPQGAGGHGGCPGARAFAFDAAAAPAQAKPAADMARPASRLTHWPVQLHLISPLAPHYEGRDVLLAADCVAYALGDFHGGLLAGRALAIACPKLDEGQEIYLDKLVALIDDARVNTITVAVMQVPCCSGLLRLAEEAVRRARRKVPVRAVTVGIRGDIIDDRWV